MGGLIGNLIHRKEEVKVEYLFNLSDFTSSLPVAGPLPSGGLDVVSQARKTEEAAVGKLYNYKYDFMEYLDAPLRSAYAQEETVQMSSDIKNKLAGKISKGDACYFPFGLGHFDHLLTRNIGLDFLNEGYNIYFYEDQPYIADQNLDLKTLYTIFREIGLKPLIEEIDFKKKCDALMLYGTQTSWEWINNISNYSYCLQDSKYYERYWVPTSNAIRF